MVVLVCILLPHRSLAQDAERITFDRFARQHGLSDEVITSIAQDQKGFLWFGTQSGLNRYDGYRYTTPFPASEGRPNPLSEGFINVLLVDQQGSLWAGMRDMGLIRFDLETGRVDSLLHPANIPQPRPGHEVLALYETRSGVLWIGTDHGLGRFEAETGGFMPVRPDTLVGPTLRVQGIYETQDGVLWIGAGERGLHRIDPATGLLERYPPDPRSPLWNTGVHAFYEDEADALWVGTENGLFVLDAARRQPQRYQQSLNGMHVTAIAGDGLGLLWVGTRRSGLYRINLSTGAVTRFSKEPANDRSLSDNWVLSLFEDRAGVFWIGTWAGLNKLILPKNWFQVYTHRPGDPNSLSDPAIKPIYEDPSGVLWIGALEEGLNRFDPQTGTFTRYRHDPNNPSSLVDDAVLAIAQAEGRALWIGSVHKGLSRFDPRTQTNTRYRHDPNDTTSLSSDQVVALYRDRAGTLWVGTRDRGLNRYDPAAGRFIRYVHDPQDSTSLSHNYVWTLYEDRTRALWIGTHGGGLNKLDRTSGRFTAYRHDDRDSLSISNDMLTSITEDGEGALWIGTRGGLNRFDPQTGRFTHFTTDDGLPDKNVSCVLPDAAGTLWISTMDGLVRFEPATGKFYTYGVHDGLLGTLFHFDSCARSETHGLLFGGSTGLVIVDPQRAAFNDHVPPVVFTSIRVNGSLWEPLASIPFLETLKLGHNENRLAFEFAALDYTNPDRNQYRFMLEGEDENWSPVDTKRDITYASLDPGDYVFRVQGSNNNGIWNEDGVALGIAIRPPFWATWWFRVLVALGIVGMLTVAYQYRIRQLRKIERTRQRIADDLHDDIGSKMSSIVLRTEVARRTLGLDEDQFKPLAGIAQTARELVDDLRDVVWIVDAGHDDLKALIDRMNQVTSQMLPGRRYRFHQPETVPSVTLTMEQRRNIFLSYKEMLHNAVRHAPGSLVETRVTYAHKTLTICVVDDGIGFDLQAVEPGRGLKTLPTRAQQLGGTFQIESTPGRGTSACLAVTIA